MADSVTGNIIAKTHQGLVPVTSDNDKTWARDQAIGEWIQVAFEDPTANAAVGKFCAVYFPYACTIKSLQLVPGITGTADATDYATILVELGTAGVLRTAATVATIAAGTNGYTAFVPKSLDAFLSTTQANLEAAAGDVLLVSVAKAAAGRAFGAAATASGSKANLFVRVERKYA